MDAQSLRGGQLLKRYLLMDAHIDTAGGARFFTPYLGRVHVDVLRVPFTTSLPSATDYDAIVITGSKANISENGALPDDGVAEGWLARASALVQEALDHNVPILGVCFGHQLLAHTVHPGCIVDRKLPEVGFFDVQHSDDPLLAAMPGTIRPFVSHGDEVGADGIDKLQILATSDSCAVHAIRVKGKRAWGVQYHLEYDPTEQRAILDGRAARHPGLNLDTVTTMDNASDCREWAHQLFGRFLEVVNDG